ncbi:TPA: alanine--tRNA ligase [Candidatus Gastranaerophilales bacterium HUM_8]|jgi:alanine--tRNA ligase|nr:MAG TPA: alanine--tRNA ligase [Candidatus Gastranaerophilales bacterium HUM_8]DAB00275.1 MAG TPA: alanine--tRNA ligase [Candidatus Gastranaerophilales bacterium HUM_11]
MLKGNEIRQLYLDYFKNKHQHTIVESSSLVPDNPTVLLTTAGMLQFLPIFLGITKSPYNPARATSCQKCARAGGKDSDIENVGRTPRHHTFFEMLGNFSFGDYYKKEVIPWAWEFVTEVLKLDKDRLWITIFETDDEAYDIWRSIGVPDERIKRKGKKDNFWGPPGASGSCGPCSEIHYDLGEQYKCSDNCGIDTCECDRWVEIWNLVFTELYQDEEGNQSPLEHKNVDTGMGLERITMVCQGVASTFETDLLRPILDKVSEMSGVPYKKSEKTDISLRIITDHARCVSFLISDGVIPGNEGRSYVLRMILRRALRHGKILGMELPFLYKLVDVVVDNYGAAYPDLVKNKAKIIDVIKKEEERFAKTLDRGYKMLEEFISEKKDIDGESAFKLYDTYGFPFELTKEIAEENGLGIDENGFKKAMQEQKDRAKAAAEKISVTGDMKYAKVENEVGSTEFVGYLVDCAQAKILAAIEGEGYTDIVLDRTPFYAECGGQVGDSGYIVNENLKAEVLTTFKVNHLFVHRCQVVNGEVKVGDYAFAQIDTARRAQIRVHHTSAHLLQAALIKVLGDEVKQAGSQVEENRMRFDFTFSRAMTPQEVKKTEDIMNKWIGEKLPVNTDVMGIEEAKLTGATALFGEKYEDVVRVVSIGGKAKCNCGSDCSCDHESGEEKEVISKEFCAGTHASNTADLRLVKIVSEGAIAAGTRRIEAVVADAAIDYLNAKSAEIDKLASRFKVHFDEVESRIEKLLEENKELQKELEETKAEMAKSKFATFVSKAQDIEGGKLFITKIENLDADAVKAGIEMLSNKLGESIIVLANERMVIVKVTDGFVKKGINAGKIVGEIARATGANGGGRPNFAQGGVKDASKLDEILAKVEGDLR